MSSNQQAFRHFVETHLAALRPIARESALAWWENALTGTDESADRAAETTARLRKLYADPGEFARLKALGGGFGDALLDRQYDVLCRAFLAEQMPPETIDRLVRLEAEVDQEYNNYRAEVAGEKLTDNDIRGILRESNDSGLRREAWESSKRLGALVEARVREMVRLRNVAARNLGFPNHYRMALELDELDEDRVFALFDQLIAESESHWQAWKSEFDRRQAERFGIAQDDLRPWHYPDLFFQEAPPGEVDLDVYFRGKDVVALTERFFAAIGLPIGEIVRISDLFERPGKSQHAFCTDIDREGDVRVLCNVVSNEQWMGTMLHEYGHAVYDFYHDPDLPYLLREPAHTLSTEAIAELMGRFSKDPVWLRIYAGVPEAEADRVGESTREETRVKFLISTRWIVTMCRFEQAMYRDPDQDLNRLWWDMVERYQGVRRPAGRDAPDWAAKLHLALAPVYYQNYLLGEMMAAQLLRHLRTVALAGQPEEALFTSPAVGEWLKEKVFRPGGRRPWEDGLEFATGERLNPAWFAAQFRR